MIRGFTIYFIPLVSRHHRGDTRIFLFNPFRWCLYQTISSVQSRVTPPGCTCGLEPGPTGVLEGKESGDPTVPAQGLYRNGRTGGYHRGPGPCSCPYDTL